MKNFKFILLFFFKSLPNFSDFINSNDLIRKVTSKPIRLYPVFIEKKLFAFNKKRDYFFLPARQGRARLARFIVLNDPASPKMVTQLCFNFFRLS